MGCLFSCKRSEEEELETEQETLSALYAASQQRCEQSAAEQRAAAQRAAEQCAAEQREAAQRAAEQCADEQREAAQRAAEQCAAEQREAAQRAAEQRADEQREAAQRAAEQRNAAEHPEAAQRAASERTAAQYVFFLAQCAAEQRKVAQREAEQCKAAQRAAEQREAAQRAAEQRTVAQAKQQHEQILRSVVMIVHVQMAVGTLTWNEMDYKTPLMYASLNAANVEYQEVMALFDNTTRNQQQVVTKIERVQNPALYGQYVLRRQEMRSLYGKVEELKLFHGCYAQYVDSICSDNFNWRFRGATRGHRYGQGVSFSPIAYYSSHYCDKIEVGKVMLLCRVLVSTECEGSEDMVLPPIYNEVKKLRYDTTVKVEKGKKTVYVKYADHEFYPMYKIHFDGPVAQSAYRGKNNRARRK